MLVQVLETHAQKSAVLKQAWDVLTSAYQKVPGGLHFDSAQALVNNTSFWEVVMDKGRLVALVVYKNKAGLKISAFAYNYACGKAGKDDLRELLTQCLQYSWIEVSDQAKPFVLQQCGGDGMRIKNDQAPQLLKLEVKYDDDDKEGFHYFRTIQGETKHKIMVGTPNRFDAFPLAA